jgi:hypothetical protein
VTQLALYADEYHRSAFAVAAPTHNVFRVSGHMPETFETIVRRHVESRSHLTPGFGRTIGAMREFLKFLMTRHFDFKKAEDARDYVHFAKPEVIHDNAEWRDSHGALVSGREPQRAASLPGTRRLACDAASCRSLAKLYRVPSLRGRVAATQDLRLV